MKDIVLNKTLPIINMNFEEVKTSLTETMERYKGIVVTEEGLKDCKATQKELSGLKKNIDTYRKTVKKEIEKPIKEFEGQCKELISLIDEVEKPIKEGIEVFNEKVREEKREYARSIISQAIAANNLEEKYSSQIHILDSYTNLTTTKKFIKEDIEEKANRLKLQQDQDKAQAEILKSTIIATVEGANSTLNTKMKAEEFYKYIERGYSIAQIVNEINRAAELIRRTEKAEKDRIELEQRRREERREEQRKEEARMIMSSIPEENNVEPVEQQDFEMNNIPSASHTRHENIQHSFEINFSVTGAKGKLMELSNFLKSNNYEYEVIYQKRI